MVNRAVLEFQKFVWGVIEELRIYKDQALGLGLDRFVIDLMRRGYRQLTPLQPLPLGRALTNPLGSHFGTWESSASRMNRKRGRDSF